MARFLTKYPKLRPLVFPLALVLMGLGATPGFLAAETPRERGERLFLEDNPVEAQGYLEQALAEEPTDFRLHMYLAMVHEQLADYTQAISLLHRASELPDAELGVVYFNLGNNYFRGGDNDSAEEYYSKAVTASTALPDAYLNRANLRVRTRDYTGAISDYTDYLRLDPRSSQRRDVERMITLLRDTQAAERRAAEEARRRAEEIARQEREAEEARAAEERRAAEEAARVAREAEERRRALLDSVLDSLGGATGEGRSVRAPGEDIEDIDDSFLDIAD